MTQGERLIEFLLLILDKEESDKAQALLCIGLAKLMLAGMVTDDRVSSYSIREHCLLPLNSGIAKPHPCICLARDCQESRVAPMSLIFFSYLLLLFASEPASDAEGA